MNTSEQYHQPVLEALCAFVRVGTKAETGDGPPATDIQAALTVVGRRSVGTGLVYLAGAHIPRASLSGANLSGADLRDAYLFGANLSGANLYGADLRDAYLVSANLSGTNLSRANLSRANLSGTTVSQTQLDQAYCVAEAKLPPGLNPRPCNSPK